ncbi:hypothetical protein Tco_0602322 [Tanacetum coccineum]
MLGILRNYKRSDSAVLLDVIIRTSDPKSLEKYGNLLQKYGKDLTAMVREGKLDPSLVEMMKYLDAFRFSLGELRTTLCSSVNQAFERLASKRLSHRIMQGDVPEALKNEQASTVNISRRILHLSAALNKLLYYVDCVKGMNFIMEHEFQIVHLLKLQSSRIAIDVVYEAAAKLKKEITSKPTALDEINRSLLQLEMERLSLTSITDKALKDRLNRLEAELALLKKKQVQLNEKSVIFTRKWTGIPLSKLKQSEMVKLLHLEEELHKGVVVQNTTVTAVAEAFQRPTAGLSDPHRPILVSTKLEFSNGTAEILKTNEQNNPRFDRFTMGFIETDL